MSADDHTPPKFCRCSRSRTSDDFGFTRNPDSGWWVHAACGRPTQAWYEAQVARPTR